MSFAARRGMIRWAGLLAAYALIVQATLLAGFGARLTAMAAEHRLPAFELCLTTTAPNAAQPLDGTSAPATKAVHCPACIGSALASALPSPDLTIRPAERAAIAVAHAATHDAFPSSRQESGHSPRGPPSLA